MASLLIPSVAEIGKDVGKEVVKQISDGINGASLKIYEDGKNFAYSASNTIARIPSNFGNAISSAINSVEESPTYIANHIDKVRKSVTDAKEIIYNSSSQTSVKPSTPVNPTVNGMKDILGSQPSSQTGGAKKTRKHMKKVIRDRVLIQSRTNKMIHEFLNPNHTIKRLKTIKTKRRRK